MSTRQYTAPRRLFLAAAVSVASLTVGLGAAQAVDFSGETVEIIVPAGPGSGADVYARALGPFLGRHLPGNPNVQIRNVPGGGTITASNEFEMRARPDGLTLMSGSTSQVINSVLQDPRVQYDLLSWRPTLVSTQGVAVYASPDLGIEGPQDMARLADQNLVYGGAGPTAADLRVILSFGLLGWETTDVWGIDRGQARLAFERGEFNLSYDSTAAYKRDIDPMIDRGIAVGLFSFGSREEDGSYARDPNFPDLPSFPEAYEIVHGEPPSGPDYEAWEAQFGLGMTLNKFFALPAGTPDDIFEAHSEAIRKMLDDPEAERARDAVLEGYRQYVGEEAERIFHETARIDDEVLAWIDNWLQENHNVSLKQ
jgi:hypothetical protein